MYKKEESLRRAYLFCVFHIVYYEIKNKILKIWIKFKRKGRFQCGGESGTISI